MAQKLAFLKKFLIIIIFLWTLVIVVFSTSTIHQNYQYAEHIALNQAQVSVKKDLAYRSWVASHGGVYVPITKQTPANPYLVHIPNRDIETTDGQHLTLMNPAYTLLQMMSNYGELYGVKGHITSDKLLNPKNRPDAWERKGMEIISRTKTPYFEIALVDSANYLRFLNPLFVEQSCLKCHASQGYQLGDFRGAVSVAIPLYELYAHAFNQSLRHGSYFFLLWLIGLLGIFWGYKHIQKYIHTQISQYEQHVYTLVDVIEKRDSYTAGHTRRVALYADKIAYQMGYKEDIRQLLFRASMLHDIGKISTPDSILLKPGKLTRLEYKLIQEHVTASHELLTKVDIFEDIAEIVRHHHEHYNGKGYPQGLTGDKIPMLSQVMTAADAFDAMTTDRIYKGRKSVKLALDELQSLSGQQFNPEVVEASLIALEDVEIDELYNQLPQTDLEQERFSYFYRDKISGAFNRDYLEFVLSRRAEQSELRDVALGDKLFKYRCVYAIFLHNFTQYNKQFSWKNGDELLALVVKTLQEISPEALVFRLFGDDFIIMHKEHYEVPKNSKAIDDVLLNTGIEISYKHVDLQQKNICSLDELETYL